jgi:capsular exopolysaccharide synthesis family protein
MFTAAREKDPNSPVSMNNIMNVSMKGANPDDAQKVLEIVVEAYRDELRGMYDDATQRRIKILEAAIESQKKRVDLDKHDYQTTSTAMAALTPESAEVMRARYSKNIELEGLLKQEQRENTGWLTQIKKVEKADKRERQKLLTRTGQYFKGQSTQFGQPRYDPNDPNTMRQEVEAAIAEQSKKLGRDHPTIQSLEARRDFLKKQAERLNPLDPDGTQDGLDLFEAFLQGRRDTINENLDALKIQIADDSAKLKDVVPMQNALENLTRNIQDRQKKIEEYESERTNTDLTRASGGYEAKTLNTPSRDIAPVAPRLNQSLLLGMAAGLLFGVGLAALAELSDKGFRSPADIRARLGLPVIGHIPPIRTNLPAEDQLDLEPTVVAALRPKSVEAEAYRGVRTALYFNAAGSTHQMIQVTSPSQGDGKSTLAANLAVSIAQSGKRTLLVDCDMRRPRVHRVFHLADPGPGLAAVINGTVPLSGAILRTPVENLSLLPCGKKPSNPAELLTSPNFPDLLDRLKSDYDYVILDTPPVLAVSDPSAVAPRADGVILVFRMTSKVRPAAERAREQLQQIGANVLGVVVNGSGRGDGGYGYGYGGEYTGYTHDQQYMDNYSHEDEDETPPKKG